MSVYLDDEQNADWLHVGWGLPDYKSEEFMEFLEWSKMSLEQFQKTDLYLNAKEQGWISADDKWVGIPEGDK